MRSPLKRWGHITRRIFTRPPREVILPQTSISITYCFSDLFADLDARYGQSLVTFDPEAERKLRWKIDLYIVPTVSVLYLFCFIDRANIGTS
jgi:hypothetical protein